MDNLNTSNIIRIHVYLTMSILLSTGLTRITKISKGGPVFSV